MYICLEDDKIKGLAVIASEPREFTIVNVIGTIDIDKLVADSKDNSAFRR